MSDLRLEPNAEVTALDPFASLVNRPRVPMTPAELDALRPKPVVTEQPAKTAAQIAYDSGIKELEGVILRIEALERTVAELRWQKNL
jgi:hypothetical protein